MKVLTYNIHGWRAPGNSALNLDPVSAVIRDSGADLVGLNEVFHPHPTPDGPALALLAERLGMCFAFAPAMTATESPTGVPYGNAFLSRWPILAYAGHRLASGSESERRGLLEARVALPDGRLLTFYVTHLDHRSEPVRLIQWAAAHTWLLRERGRLHLLVGDFNAIARSDYAAAGAAAALEERCVALGWRPPAFDLIGQVLKAGYVDAFATVGSGVSATFPVHAPEIRIDYIFVPPAQAEALVRCQRWEHPLVVAASDHMPMLAELT